MSTGSVATRDDSMLSRRRLWPLLAALSLALFLSELDQNAFTVALPTVLGELGGVDRLVELNTGYVAAATLGMPLYGRLGDRYGRRPVFVFGLAVFLLGSALGVLAGSLTMLIVARVVQGLGGGGLLILVEAILADVIPARRRPPYLAAMGAVFAGSALLGPVVGGWLTQAAGWRWIFAINLPLGAMALIAATRLVPGRDPEVGAVPLWPLIPAEIFRHRNFAVATAAGLVSAVAFFGLVGYLPLYLQTVVSLGPAAAGWWMLTLVGGLGGSTVLIARIVRRTGRYRRIPVLGTSTAAAALVVLATLPAETSPPLVGAVLFVLGAGMGAVVEIVLLVAQDAVPPRLIGSATATFGFGREIGVTVGSAIVGAGLSAGLTPLGPGPDPVGAATAYAPVLLSLAPVLLIAAALLMLLQPRPLRTA